MSTYTSEQVRRHFGELVERAYYQNQQIRVNRNCRPMARLVGEPLMRAIDALVLTNPDLRETIEIMMDSDLMETIETGIEDAAQGNTQPLSSLLER